MNDIIYTMAFFGAPILFVAVMAMPPALKQRSWKTFLFAFLKVVFLIVLPWMAFLGSFMFMPEWTGECRYGWFDCFFSGKLALTPLVIWATVALYAADVIQIQNPNQPWIVSGYLLGSTIGITCTFHGMAMLFGSTYGGLGPGINVPIYVSIWFTFRLIQTSRDGVLTASLSIATLVGSLPFWVASFYFSHKLFSDLPDT
ncbi:MAG: hypothetical protein O3A51_09960, partial [Verrucomicrobia bacterium]|nr:hypothetical protein [Verrucomicrobiota bacterium]